MYQKVLKTNTLLYYISVVLISISKSLPHSILTVLLLEKGLSISNIILIQSLFSLAILLFEIPSGVWSDIYSRKFMYICSNIFLIIFYFIVIYSNSVYLLSIAWLIYGLSQAINTGTLDADLINGIKEYQKGNSLNKINKLLKNSNQLNLLFVILASSLGSYLYYIIGINMYYLSIIFVILSILVTMFYKNLPHTNTSKNSTIKLHIKLSLEELKENTILKLILVLSLVGQVFFQTHFQLWQAYFLSKNFPAQKFYLLYIVFQISSFIAFSIPTNYAKKFNYIVRYALFLIILLPLLLLNNIYIVIPVYIIYTFSFVVLDYFINCMFANKVSVNNISSLTSIKSSISRISAFLVLLISSILLKLIKVEYIVVFNFFISITIISITILLYYNYIKEK